MFFLRSKEVILFAKLISSHFSSFSPGVMQAEDINSFKNVNKVVVDMLN